MKRNNNIVFVVELFMLFLILLLVIVVLTQTLITTRGESVYAARLNEAVILAESAAEVVSSAEDAKEAAGLLESMDRAVPVKEESGEDVSCVRIKFSDRPDADDTYIMRVTMKEESGTTGTYLDSVIDVYMENEEEPVYTLETGHYASKGGGAI